MNQIHPIKITNVSSVYTTEGAKIVAGTRIKGILHDGDTIMQGTFEIGTVGEDGNLTFHFILNEDGNIGINVDEPSAKLHVHGSVRLSNIQGSGELLGIDTEGYLQRVDTELYADKNIVIPVNYKLFEIISHGLGKEPAVSVVGDDNLESIADIEHIDENTVKVTFSDYFTGKILFN